MLARHQAQAARGWTYSRTFTESGFLCEASPTPADTPAIPQKGSARNFFALTTVCFPVGQKRGNVMLSTILIIVLILLLIGALPTWPYSAGWGYYPGGGLGLILIIVIILARMGRV
jgi:hypothetical protein